MPMEFVRRWSAQHGSHEKVIIFSFVSIAALTSLIYVIFGSENTGKGRRKLAKIDSCPGLINQGNSCFLNAILQACSTSRALRRWLELQQVYSSGERLSDKLLHILKVLNNEVDEGDCANPYAVIDGLRAKRWVISTDEQDAHELFEVLTQSLDEERFLYDNVIPLFDAARLENNHCESCVNRWRTDPPRLVRDKPHVYQGRSATKLQCTRCQYTCPVKYDSFDCLSLTLPSVRKGPCDLSQLLKSFVKPEIVEEVDCQGCTERYQQSNPGAVLSPKKSTFTKQTFLGKLPPALCIHIQRTIWLNNGFPCKRFDHVTFPEYLSMDSYTDTTRTSLLQQTRGLLGGSSGSIVGPQPKPTKSPSITGQVNLPLLTTPPAEPATLTASGRLYRLDAVIEHLGDVSSGHFVTHRRAPYSMGSLAANPNWLHTSDTLVKRTNWTRVRASAAYMLFYERVRF